MTKEEKGYELLWSVLMYVNYITPDNGAFELIQGKTEEFPSCGSSRLWVRGNKWEAITKLVRTRNVTRSHTLTGLRSA